MAKPWFVDAFKCKTRMGLLRAHYVSIMARAVGRGHALRVSEYMDYGNSLIHFFQNSQLFDNAGARLHALQNAVAELDPLAAQIAEAAQKLKDLNAQVRVARRHIRHAEAGLVNYVNEVANGADELVDQSPFNQKSLGHRILEVGEVEGVKVVNLPEPLMAQISWNPAEGAQGYILQFSVGSDKGPWMMLDTATKSTRLSAPIRIDGDGVDRQAAAPLIYFRVAATIRGKRGPWSHAGKDFIS